MSWLSLSLWPARNMFLKYLTIASVDSLYTILKKFSAKKISTISHLTNSEESELS